MYLKKTSLEYFLECLPLNSIFKDKLLITDDDKKMFFENSERGLHKEMIKDNYFNDGFNVLREGKSNHIFLKKEKAIILFHSGISPHKNDLNSH